MQKECKNNLLYASKSHQNLIKNSKKYTKNAKGKVADLRRLTREGFEPSPVKTAALMQRLRPLGHLALYI